ncbi:MAG: GNAT family N-acetyltransferase [Chloroflexota bacterium]|nr:GNAT family N-acetyltransferase [Chloroflexota bacterium]
MPGAGAGPDVEVNRDLGGGLALRRSGPADRERIAAFHANTLLGPDETPPLERLQYWLLDMLGGEHPTGTPGDFLYVEDVASGQIVSSVGLFSVTWTFDGIEIPIGQADVVSTSPQFRRRGLVATQFAEIHTWSERRGHLMQVVPGIPWYYRQFGYEYALNLEGGRLAYLANVPELPEGTSDPFTLRPLTETDIPFLIDRYRQACARSLVAVPRDAAFWRFDAFGRHEQSGLASEHFVIVPEGQPNAPVGAVIVARRLWGTQLGVRFLEVAPGTPMVAVAPSLLRALDALGPRTAARTGKQYDAICFELGAQHPLFDAFPHALPRELKPYAWYIRIPDLPRFLNAVAPALERRLAASPEAGWSGDLRLSFYRSGVKLRVASGRVTAEPWQPERSEDGDALFPDLTFLKVLLGYRSLADVQDAWPDCIVESPMAQALLPILFPRRHSHIWDPT